MALTGQAQPDTAAMTPRFGGTSRGKLLAPDPVQAVSGFLLTLVALVSVLRRKILITPIVPPGWHVKVHCDYLTGK